MYEDLDGYKMQGTDFKRYPAKGTRIPTKEIFIPPKNLIDFCIHSEHAPYVYLLWVFLNDNLTKELLKMAAFNKLPTTATVIKKMREEFGEFESEYANPEYKIIFDEMLEQIYSRYDFVLLKKIVLDKRHIFGAIDECDVYIDREIQFSAPHIVEPYYNFEDYDAYYPMSAVSLEEHPEILELLDNLPDEYEENNNENDDDPLGPDYNN